MPRLVVDVDFFDNRLNFFTLVGLTRFFDVPFDHLAVDEERGVGVAFAVKRGVQRPQAEFGLGDDEVFGFDLVVKVVVEFAHVEDGNGRREFAVQDDVDAVRCSVTAVR